MTFRFLLDGVSINLVDHLDTIQSPLYEDDFIKLNEDEFYMHIPHVANIKASQGNSIQVQVIGELDVKSIELYLNGSVLGAILHQRKTLPYHASSVEYKGKAILLCGESGAGKSTLTYGLSLRQEFEFLTDDITPVRLENDTIYVNAISERMKLWANALDDFGEDYSNLELIRSGTDKYFMPISSSKQYVELGTIFFLEESNSTELSIEELQGTTIVQHLLENVYRAEFLDGMKNTEMDYFKTHSKIASQVKSYCVKRPQGSDVNMVLDSICTIINQ